MGRIPVSPPGSGSTPEVEPTKGWFPKLSTALGESLGASWLLLFALEQLRPGMVSTVWDLNTLLVVAALLLAASLILGEKVSKMNSLVAALVALLVVLAAIPYLPNEWQVLAPLAGLLVWLLLKYATQNYD